MVRPHPWTLGQRRDRSGLGVDGFFAPGGVEAALPFLIGLGRIEIIPFVRKLVLREIGVEVGIREVKERADLERAEVFVVGNNIEAGAIWVLDLAERGDPDGRG